MTVKRSDQLLGWEQIVLRTARNMVEVTGWTQGARARDHSGGSVNPIEFEASSFSLVGAVDVAFWIHEPITLHYGNKKLLADKKADILRRLKDRSADDLQRWNDEKERRAAHVVDLIAQVAWSYGDRGDSRGHCDGVNVVRPA